MNDLELMTWLQLQLASPPVDGLMVGATYALGALPVLATALARRHRQTSQALWVAMLVALGASLVLQQLGMRPRPDAARLLLPAPDFPSFPSGHAAIAFAFAAVLGLRWRRWAVPGLLGAALISYSRVHVGHHFVTDVLAGAALGAGIGVATYGLLLDGSVGVRRWRWLGAAALGVVVVITTMAYVDALPKELIVRVPHADRVLHFLLIGSLAFWTQLWLPERLRDRRLLAVPVAVALPLLVAAAEETAQALSPVRTSDPVDMACDLAGMVVFWAAARALQRSPWAGGVTPASPAASPQRSIGS